MKSPLIYPALVAASLHLGFLFGFKGVSQAELPGDSGPTYALPLIPKSLDWPLPPDEPDLVVDSAKTPAAVNDFQKVMTAAQTARTPPPGPEITAEQSTVKPDAIQVTGSLTPFDPHAGEADNSLIGSISAIGVQGLDTIPRATYRASPNYPLQLRQAGVEGRAEITFVVDRSGRVISTHVEGATHWEFSREAENAVKRWRFEPGRKNGQTVRFKMTVPIIFNVTES